MNVTELFSDSPPKYTCSSIYEWKIDLHMQIG